MLDESQGAYDSAAVWLERVEEKMAGSKQTGGKLPDVLQTEWIVAKVHSLLVRDLPTAAQLLMSQNVGLADLEQVENTGARNPTPAVSLGRYLALAYVLRNQGRFPEAARLLGRIIRLAETLPDMAIRIEALALLSTLQPNHPAYLEQAINFAAPEGYILPFLRPGGALLQPLLQAIARGIQPAFTHRLHAALVEQQRKQPTMPFATPGFPRKSPEQYPVQDEKILVEPLTDREKQVLRLLSAGLSSTAVAEELVISVSTARSYIKNIYAKLDAHNRTEAIEKAAQLGIL
jgi:DNA-binding NarL/FixJ family response regulator